MLWVLDWSGSWVANLLAGLMDRQAGASLATGEWNAVETADK
jgi:hypothetical protein